MSAPIKHGDSSNGGKKRCTKKGNRQPGKAVDDAERGVAKKRKTMLSPEGRETFTTKRIDKGYFEDENSLVSDY
ncbi:hypothetical protein C3432_26140 [Citrobacter amalonaticus]|uniref:Uncharacterized protein n=1 Tax=Citrobacter amalonaticus TaxID=35703 RepID=A0A2S4RPT5_CITAM|nr:hypothetical protein [Citrobacter amalonaticus]POT54763.1 hypothetical protein C3432_26140 [Citrobacter amalonaticus]POT68935.1 hypothetical protein C3436_27045 [Citrobacter amalonaticus]POU59073.1 hypothetical protein C3430_27020 [Citrobacter amalonaticus]POV02307.1 hypothetical protein C3424_27130 [Citrobacter amalonaticus]